MKPQRGFLLIWAIFLLVILAALAVVVGRIWTDANETVAVSVLDVRAWASVQSGAEWASRHATMDPAALSCGSATGVSFVVGRDRVTVICSEGPLIREGGEPAYVVRALTVTAEQAGLPGSGRISRTISLTVRGPP